MAEYMAVRQSGPLAEQKLKMLREVAQAKAKQSDKAATTKAGGSADTKTRKK